MVDDVILVDDAHPTAWVYFSLTVTNVSDPVLPFFSTVSATHVVRVADLPKTSGLAAGLNAALTARHLLGADADHVRNLRGQSTMNNLAPRGARDRWAS